MERRVLTWIAVLSLGLFFLITFLQILEYRSSTKAEHPIPKGYDFVADTSVLIEKYDPLRQRLQAAMTLTVQAVEEGLDIHEVGLGFTSDPEEKSYALTYFDQASPEFIHQERPLGDRTTFVDSAKITRQIFIPLEVVHHPIFYPFDRYGFSLELHGCVNDTSGCIEGDNLAFRGFTVEYGTIQIEKNLLVSARTTSGTLYEFDIRRAGFLQLTTILLSAVALVFFWVMLRYFKKEDVFKGALGYLGALWGMRSILVPKSVTIFPSLIDYLVLTLFTVLFTALLARYLLEKEA